MTSTTTSTPSPQSTTELEAHLARLSRAEHIALGSECLRSLNRRAKTASPRERNKIYGAKTEFLRCAVLGGASTSVERFQYWTESGEVSCFICDRVWSGPRSSKCHWCGVAGVPEGQLRDWYVVEVAGNRFHVPPWQPIKCLKKASKKVKADHDPYERKLLDVPDVLVVLPSGTVSLTDKEKLRVVRRTAAAIVSST